MTVRKKQVRLDKKGTAEMYSPMTANYDEEEVYLGETERDFRDDKTLDLVLAVICKQHIGVT